jgi:purine-binding chemotaxis protein CheW
MKRPGIDWDLARSRLQESGRALEEAFSESPERVEAAYRLRAARLAKVPVERMSLLPALPALVFRLGQERFAIELKEVAEALPFARCTPVPGSPPQFAGVINLRGELRTVLDLGRLLALTGNQQAAAPFVLMLSRQGQGIGLKVDQIEELREIRPEELAPPAQGSYVRGIASGTLMMLSVDTVLAAVFSKTGALST